MADTASDPVIDTPVAATEANSGEEVKFTVRNTGS